MPYALKEVKGGYYVINEKTGKRYSEKPMSRERAIKQLRALYLRTGGK
jgi:hypothetical protein